MPAPVLDSVGPGIRLLTSPSLARLAALHTLRNTGEEFWSALAQRRRYLCKYNCKRKKVKANIYHSSPFRFSPNMSATCGGHLKRSRCELQGLQPRRCLVLRETSYPALPATQRCPSVGLPAPPGKSQENTPKAQEPQLHCSGENHRF